MAGKGMAMTTTGTTQKVAGAKRGYLNQMIAAMQRFEWDMHHSVARDSRIPREWREVWENRTSKKQKVTLWIDADVVKLFKSMGPGYGPRMNEVLRSFMFARMAGMIEGEDLLGEYRQMWMGQPKPQVVEAKVTYARACGDV